MQEREEGQRAEGTRPSAFARRPGAGPRVALVGPCGAGKSTIALRLRALGLDARMPAQEHSGVPDMWKKLLKPDYLIALDAPNEVLRQRRPGGFALHDAALAEERRRLAHAFAHADAHLDTSGLTIEQTVSWVLAWLEARGVSVPTEQEDGSAPSLRADNPGPTEKREETL